MPNRKKKFVRPTGIGGTDAARLVEGNWKDLWLEKIGETERKDLSDILPVQMGIYTEEFNRKWYQQQTNTRVITKQEVFTHPEYDYIYGSLDGICNGKVWEGKHTNTFTKDETLTSRYYPQLQHYMMVTGFRKAILSVLHGNAKHSIFEIEADKEYQSSLQTACHIFWFMVQNKIEPPDYVDFDTMKGIENEQDVIKQFGEEVSIGSWIQRTVH